MRAARTAGVVVLSVLVCAVIVLALQPDRRDSEPSIQPLIPGSEFHFLRVEYVDLFSARRGWGRGWWRQDWPEADVHFSQGIRRLTRIDTGDERHLPLTDDRIYDYPWIYATQVGYWDLRDREIARLREYLLRGGFLVVDDFYGPQDWTVFRDSMERTLPGRPIIDIENDDRLMNVLYSITERVQIPGLRHLRAGPGGRIEVQPQPWPPTWRAIYDDHGRMVVAINFNMDVGDAWEHADMPEYPEAMTTLAYRFGINYVIYSMTR
jgi:hypothetical protein